MNADRSILCSDGEAGSMGLYHWEFFSHSSSCLLHRVSGFGYQANERLEPVFAWHPTLRSRSIYAMVEGLRTDVKAVHLMNANQHTRLMTWTSEQLNAIMLPGNWRNTGAKVATRWSPDGRRLAAIGQGGLMVFNFGEAFST